MKMRWDLKFLYPVVGYVLVYLSVLTFVPICTLKGFYPAAVAGLCLSSAMGFILNGLVMFSADSHDKGILQLLVGTTFLSACLFMFALTSGVAVVYLAPAYFAGSCQ